MTRNFLLPFTVMRVPAETVCGTFNIHSCPATGSMTISWQPVSVAGGITFPAQLAATFQFPEPMKLYVFPVGVTATVMLFETDTSLLANVKLILGLSTPELGPVARLQASAPPAPSAW